MTALCRLLLMIPPVFFFTSVSVRSQVVDRSRLGEGVTDHGRIMGLSDSQELRPMGLEEENAFAPFSPGDSDIGQQLILKETPRDRWFRAYADLFGYWTNNAANAPAGEQDDWFWGGRIGAGYQPRLASRLFADIDLQQQMFRYDKFDVLDFESLDATAGLIWIEPRLANTIFFAQYNYNRITNDEFGSDLLNSHSLRAGLQKTFLIDRRNSIHATLMGDWDIDTDVDSLYRFEYIASLGWRFKIFHDLSFGVSYRHTWFDYQDVDRSDSLHIIGGGLAWTPREWLELSLGANFSVNESDIDVFDYETSTLGGGLGVKIKF